MGGRMGRPRALLFLQCRAKGGRRMKLRGLQRGLLSAKGRLCYSHG